MTFIFLQSSLYGVLANPNFVKYLNCLSGRQVLVETEGGEQFMGVLGAVSPNLDIGLTYAWQRTPENANNIFPKESEIQQKLVFNWSHIMSVSSIWSEEKVVKGFATDRDYHSKQRGFDDEEELEVWECDDGVEIDLCTLDQRPNHKKKTGWSADEMFEENKRRYKVQSTFSQDLRQYTTVDFQGTDEERARADLIARQIEKDSRSKFYAELENDDIERDLDKKTTKQDLEEKTVVVEIQENVVDEIDVDMLEKNQINDDLNPEVDEVDLDIDCHEDEKGTDSPKKFTFNPNAQIFVPRQTPGSPGTQGPLLQVPTGGAPPGMPIPPPGMVVPPGQPMMNPHWQHGFYQPGPYPIYIHNPPIVTSIPMGRGNGIQVASYPNQSNQRRATNGPQPQHMVLPQGQWHGQYGGIMMPPIGYYQYPPPPPGVGPHPQYAMNTQIAPPGNQGISPGMYNYSEMYV